MSQSGENMTTPKYPKIRYMARLSCIPFYKLPNIYLQVYKDSDEIFSMSIVYDVVSD